MCENKWTDTESIPKDEYYQSISIGAWKNDGYHSKLYDALYQTISTDVSAVWFFLF